MIAEASTVALRTVYSAEQFATEILQGHRTARWVADECRYKRIKTVGARPWMIPRSEALRFISPTR